MFAYVWISSLNIPQRAFNPYKISLRSRGSRGLFSSFIYTLMHYFSYEIGLFFAFFHVKCTETFYCFSKYIGILDLVRVGEYWQKPLCCGGISRGFLILWAKPEKGGSQLFFRDLTTLDSKQAKVSMFSQQEDAAI